jgi:nitrate reductase gamma subunit
MQNNFYNGLVFGFIAAGLIGLILNRIREARARMGQRNRPLNTFPDAIQPRMTPASIVRNSLLATFSCVFWIIVLVVVVLLLIGMIPHVMGSVT